MATNVGKNSRGGIAKIGKNSSAEKKAQYSTTSTGTLTNKLSSTIDQAKALGINTGKAESMLAQTKAEGSTPYKGSSYESAFDVLSSQNMASQGQIKLPDQPKPTDPGNIAGANMAGLASMMPGYQLDQNGMLTKVQTEGSADTSGFSKILNEYMGLQEAPPDFEKMYRKMPEQQAYQDAQREVNNYTAQLNSIVAKQQQDLLSLRGTGSANGVTEAVYGGQQAQINREAAIAALPVQAQLAAAQGNLEMAQQHLDTMFKLRVQDAEMKYNHRSKVLDTLFKFANDQETRRLDSLRREEDRAYQDNRTNLSLQNEWAKTAIEFGQNSLAGRISGLDSKSPTFQQDLAALQAQIRKPVATSGGTQDWTLFNQADGTTVMYNQRTGEVKPMGSMPGGQMDARKYSESQNKLDSLLGYTNQALLLSGSSGLGLYNRAANILTGDSNYNRLSNLVDTLKTNLLTLNTDPAIKKFFGPQMSNRDTELMVSAGSTLNAEKQSPSDMKKEIEEYQGFLKRAKGWTYLGNGGLLTVKLKDPSTGNVADVTVDYDTLSQAISDGAEVTF